MRLPSYLLRLLALLILMTLVSVSYGIAASVRQVSMDEMLRVCGLVFEGTVVYREAKENRNKRIHTYVTFEIQEIIKGEYPGDSITLRFLGGTAGGVAMRVSDMEFPEVGEHGIYFVESVKRHQVNPLYGWSQGHFLVEPDDTGTQRVLTKGKHPVKEVKSDAQLPSVQGPAKLSTGVARGIIVAREQGAKGLTPGQFKKILYERLAEIQ